MSSSSSSASLSLEDAQDACSICLLRQSSSANIANEVFQINTDPKCGHKFCGSCLHDIFANQGKRQFACKTCAASGRSSTVKKEKLSIKTLDETEAERDVRMRRKIKDIFNKTEESFASAAEFRDYDEEVEDIIYNLVHDIDVAATMQKVERYKKDNEEAIYLNHSKHLEQRGEQDRKIREQDELTQNNLAQAHEAAHKERLYKKEHAKQINQMLLGERDCIDMGGLDKGGAGGGGGGGGGLAGGGGGDAGGVGGAVAPIVYAQNHVFALLHTRDLPKVVVLQSAHKSVVTNTERRAAHVAGGYDEKNRWRRNWAEIVSHPVFRGQTMDVEGAVPSWD